MSNKTKAIIAQIVADGIMTANVVHQMFFASEPASWDRFNCLIAGGMAGAYIMYRLKVQKCWRKQ